jgi:hypothetical protein
VELVCIPLGAIAVDLLLPFHHVGFAAVFLDQPGDAVTALARTFGAFDAEHVELAFDVTENEISTGYLGDHLFDHLVGAKQD